MLQFSSIIGQKSVNLSTAADMIEALALERADLIILPEMCSTGYYFQTPQAIAPLVEPAQGYTFEFFSALAKKHQLYLVYGYPEVYQNNYYNSQNFIDPQGALILTYRKQNLFEFDELWAKPGIGGYVNQLTPLGKVGLGICMDMNADSFLAFHEQAKSDIVAISSCWLGENSSPLDYWQLQWQQFSGLVAIANTHGTQGSTHFSGYSCIIENNQLLAHCGATRDQGLVVEHCLFKTK